MTTHTRPYIPAAHIRRLMTRTHCTIRDLAQRTGITMKRIREVRLAGWMCPHVALDWIEAITGRKIVDSMSENGYGIDIHDKYAVLAWCKRVIAEVLAGK